jgi:hypothetical protein
MSPPISFPDQSLILCWSRASLSFRELPSPSIQQLRIAHQMPPKAIGWAAYLDRYLRERRWWKWETSPKVNLDETPKCSPQVNFLDVTMVDLFR